MTWRVKWCALGHMASYFLQVDVKYIFHININSQAPLFEISQHISLTCH